LLAKCFSGSSNIEVLKPDKDLSMEERFSKPRVMTAKPIDHDPNRVFGTPSIRKDLVFNENNYKSITNANVKKNLI
jgi:hypothetical protein